MSKRQNHHLSEPKLVDSADGVARVCHRLAESKRFAFDAEFITEEGFEPQLCLLQVATDQDVWLIDPIDPASPKHKLALDLTAFWELVADDSVEVIVHAGLEDLALCYQHIKRVPRNVFDIQIAAGWVGLNYPLNLQKLARSICRVELHKSQTLTDWNARPLTPEQIQYAAEDVAHLPEIHAVIQRRLLSAGRTEWADEEFARYTDERTYRQDELDLLWRVKGVGSLPPKELAIAKELVNERRALAKRYNRPARSVLKDHLLVAIARHRWTSPGAIKSLRGLHLRVDAIDALAQAVKRGLDLPPDRWPKSTKTDDLTVAEVTLCKLVSAVLHDFCRTEKIAYALLATKKDIERLVLAQVRSAKPDTPERQGALQTGWRARAIGDLVAQLLSGENSVRVDTSSGAPRLIVE